MVSLGAGAAARRGRAPRRPSHLPLRLIALLAALAGLWVLAAPAMGEPECASAPNPVACENALPGDPASDWQVQGVGDPTIQGFATSMSVNAGQAINFKVNTPASSYHIDILRLGYYGGDGARLIASNIQPTAELPQTQPECLKDPSTGLIDCGNWGVSASWTVPANAVSGVYVAHLVRNDTGGYSQIPFVVRNDASHSEILVTDLRRDLGGVQHLRRQQPLHLHGRLPERQPEHLQGCLRGLLQPPLQRRLQRRQRGLLPLLRRIPDDATGWRRTATTSATPASRKSTTAARC